LALVENHTGTRDSQVETVEKNQDLELELELEPEQVDRQTALEPAVVHFHCQWRKERVQAEVLAHLNAD
jgi:hypothetical protein